MAVPVLSDLDLFGNKVVSPVLQAAKFGSKPASPNPGEFFMQDGILHYRNAFNADSPVHDNAVTAVVSNGVGSLAVATNPETRTAIISIQEATSTLSGLLSPELFDLLNTATDYAIANTLVLRDNIGGTKFDDIELDNISASGNITTAANVYASGNILTTANLIAPALRGLSSNQDDDDGSFAVSLGYLRNQLQSIQNSIASRDFKNNVRVALTTNTLLTITPGVYDGVTINSQDSIALVGQTNPHQNGVYVITSGGLIRRSDSDSSNVLSVGATYPVTEGTLSGRLIMLASQILASDIEQQDQNFIVIDDSVIAGDGLVKTGKTVHAVGTANRIAVNADSIDIATTWDGTGNSISVLGSVTTGTWSANQIAVAFGGTGATSAPDALTNLGAVQEETPILLGDGSATSFTVTSSLNNPAPSVEGFFLVSGDWVRVPDLDVRVDPTTRAITVYAQQGSNAIATNSLKVIVRGKKYL